MTGQKLAKGDRVRVVGFTGYAGSGKDVAAFVCMNMGYQRLSFGDLVRQEVYDKDFGYNVRYMVDDHGWETSKRIYPFVRKALQDHGTKKRDIDPEYWVEKVETNIKWRPRDLFVIPDVRYPNEVEMIRRQGGMIVRIERPGVGPVNSHDSETNVPQLDVDHVIVNDGTLSDLAEKVRSLL